MTGEIFTHVDALFSPHFHHEQHVWAYQFYVINVIEVVLIKATSPRRSP